MLNTSTTIHRSKTQQNIRKTKRVKTPIRVKSSPSIPDIIPNVQKKDIIKHNAPLAPKFIMLPENIEIESPPPQICIIIPHRNRNDQLKKFISLWKKTANVDIYVIDQNNGDKFNRGLLLNVGFALAKLKGYERYIFHDVDSFPEPILRKQYFVDTVKYPIVHYASPHLGYKYKFTHFFGGVVGFNEQSFKAINGFPNNIFGWGGEDDILRQRVAISKIPVARPQKGMYILDDHDAPLKFELSFGNTEEKWQKIINDTKTSGINGVRQLNDLFITVYKCETWKEFITLYNVPNIQLPFTLLGDMVASNDSTGSNVFYYKIDYLAEHIRKKNGIGYIDNLLQSGYVQTQQRRNLSRFNGTPIFYKNNKQSPFYNYIEPLVLWEEIESRIIDTYKKPLLQRHHRDIVKPELIELVDKQFEQYDIYNKRKRLTKTDLKHTLKHIFDHYNEALFFRIRGGIVTDEFYLFNLKSPKIDWYKDLKWGKNEDVENKNSIQQLQQFVEKSKDQRFFTLAKPESRLRANGCLLGVENTDYMRELNNSYVKGIAEMIQSTVKTLRNAPDCDLIINRKDFAYFNINNTFAYDHLLNSVPIDNPPKKWFPVFSQSKIPNKHLDVCIPSADEWEALKTPPTPTKWLSKKSMGIFRGSSTGCGTTIDNNPRLRLAKISTKWEEHPNRKGYIDIGITRLTNRFKAFDQTVSFIDQKENADLLGNFLDSNKQAYYKYVFVIQGNAQAYRFPLEFYKGSVVISLENKKTPQMWFQPLLRDGNEYIKILDTHNFAKQETLLYDMIHYLKHNDNIAEQIGQNGLQFARTYLTRHTICEYWYSIMHKMNYLAQ